MAPSNRMDAALSRESVEAPVRHMRLAQGAGGIMLPVLPRCCGNSGPGSAIDAWRRRRGGWWRAGLWGHSAGIRLTPQSLHRSLHAPPFLLGLIDALCFLIDSTHGGPTHEVSHIHAAPRRRQRPPDG